VALIDAGSNLEAKDKVSGTLPLSSRRPHLFASQTRQTALTCAVRSGKLPCVTLLLDRGGTRNLDQLVACTVSYLRSRSPRRGVVGGRGGEHPRPPPPGYDSEPGQVFLQASFARGYNRIFDL